MTSPWEVRSRPPVGRPFLSFRGGHKESLEGLHFSPHQGFIFSIVVNRCELLPKMSHEEKGALFTFRTFGAI